MAFLSMDVADKAPPHSHARSALRSDLRARRRALSPEIAAQMARAVAREAARFAPVYGARHLAVYLPVGGELDTFPLIEDAWRRGQQVYLPMLRGDRLHFLPYLPDSTLVLNRYGIPEPAYRRGRWHSARDMDVILAPVVGFDSKGNRLGMGAAFYDRTLAHRLQSRCYQRPWFIGLAFGFQEVRSMVAAPWDVPLDAVITERGSHRYHSRTSPSSPNDE